jgi:putative peptidoglycan lipid II flippase
LATLLKQKVYQPGSGWGLFILRVVLACSCMALFLLYFVDAQNWLGWDVSQRGSQLTIAVGLAMLVYLFALGLSGIRIRHLTEH